MTVQKRNKDQQTGLMGENETKFHALRAKLLALNAAFEAARTGKAGAAFAVAAGEAGSPTMKGIRTQGK